MGCGSSKFKQSKCNHCKAPLSSVSRSYSKLVHHPPSKEGDSYHVVALTSSTLGSLSLDHRSISPPTPTKPMPYYASFNGRLLHAEAAAEENTKAGFEVDMLEAKAWSKMIDEKLPKSTPAGTPPGEPETINYWEMMEGLEEEEEEVNNKPQVSSHPHPHINVSPNEIEMPADVMESENGSTLDEDEDEDCLSNPKDDSVASEVDTQVISSFKKALDELSPTNPFHLSKYPPNCNNNNNNNNNVHDDDAVEDLKKVNGALEMHLPYGYGTQLNVSIEKEGRERADCFSSKDVKDRRKGDVNAKEKLTLYFTSLRGIRKTYEDCCEVKLIFKGLGVRVDERDVSMHSAFKEELRELLGESHKGGALPRVFVEDRYIGGAEDIRRMDEEGSLIKALRRCEFFVEDQRYGFHGRTCEACGDVRFVPCETCSGSCKVYCEADEDEDEQLEEEDEFGFQRCPDCNENGLIRCPLCCH